MVEALSWQSQDFSNKVSGGKQRRLREVQNVEPKDAKEFFFDQAREVLKFFEETEEQIRTWCHTPPEELSDLQTEITAFTIRLRRIPLLQSVRYVEIINQAFGDGSQIAHDLRNDIGSATVIEADAFADKARKGELFRDVDLLRDDLEVLYSRLYVFVSILEDVLIRETWDTTVPDSCPKRPLDIEALQNFLVDYVPGTSKAVNTIGPNEEVQTVRGTVINAIANMIRNARKEAVNAPHLSVTTTREGDELVYRVIDDGKGMAKEQLNPANLEQFIFRKGVSGTGSTGLGLAGLHTRIESIGGRMTVMTRQRDSGSDEFVTYVSSGEGGEWPKEDGMRFRPSTIFEIRLPIQTRTTN